MKLYLPLFLSTLFSIYSSIGMAQDYLFDVEVIGVEDGLPEREVYDMVVDKKGYLWISTQGAISRYDGNQFKTYTAQTLNIGEYNQTSLVVDEQNNIWYIEHTDLEKNSGVIDPFRDSVLTIEQYTDGLFHGKEVLNLNDTYQDPFCWFLTTQQGVIHAYKNGDFQKVYDGVRNEVQDLPYFESNNDKGENWVLQGKRAVRLAGKTPIDTFIIDKPYLNFWRVLQQAPSLVIESVSSKSGQEYWEFKDNQLVPYQTSDHFSFQRILLLEENFNVFTLEDTLIIRDNKQQLLLKQKNPLGKNVEKGFYLKKQDVLFLQSSDGILKITRRKNPFQLFYPNYSVRGLYPKANSLWISGGMGNKHIALSNNTSKDLSDELRTATTISPFTKNYQTEDNHLWVGTEMNKLIEYIPDEQKVQTYEVKQDYSLLIPFQNNRTKKIWVGTAKGLTYFDKTNKQLVPYDLPNINKGIAIRHFHQNENGIWILTSEGVFLMDAQTETILEHYTTDKGLPYHNFMHLHEDKNGLFWLATKGGGLIRWNPTQQVFQQFTKAQGLSNTVLYAVYEDAYENLWLPSNYGLMKFNKATFSIRAYLPKNGLPHEEFNTFAHAQAADGTLYFGGLGGAIGFHPKNIQAEITTHVLPLYVTTVSVLDNGVNEFRDITKSYLTNHAIELAPDYQTLSLSLSFLNFQSTKEIQYAYQIEGYQNQWTITTDNTISIFKLPYGDYQVKIKAKALSGTWTEEIVSFPLTVRTPFYLQTWFLTATFCLFILGLLGLIKRREIKLQKDKERLKEEVKKRTAIIETQTEELKQLDKAKTRFFDNITHEFRTPLTLIIGPLQQMMKDPTKEYQPKRLGSVIKNAQHILHLINQLLDISKLESRKMKLEITHGNIIEYTQQLVGRFEEMAKQKQQRLVFHAKPAAWKTHFDKDKWNKIIYNILTNAIKFTPENGVIQVSLSKLMKEEMEWVHLKIKDSGIGIPQKKLAQIFNRFYQADDAPTRQQEGTGIGLALVKELVELQDGLITVQSQVNLGTTFDIQLPIVLGPSPQVAIEETPIMLPLPLEIESAIPLEQSIIEELKSEDKLKLLLVEDNREMLMYIESCLDSKNYTIITASNGQEGIKKATELMPDLIVSDVMMPITDGFEMTRIIRQQLATSHIPIILLTAKAALESKLVGLKRGADAYLTKPFSPEELLLRIQKLIEMRQLLQKRYQKDNFQKDTEVEIYQKEDDFILLSKRIIITHIDDAELNGDRVAKKIGISRMQLHRKLKALTNQSTSQFIQNIRLEKAYELLKEKEFNVSEVTYRTGFSHPNHFSRVFKKKYGKAPSKIME